MKSWCKTKNHDEPDRAKLTMAMQRVEHPAWSFFWGVSRGHFCS